MLDDVLQEQIKFQQYSRTTSKLRQEYIRTYKKRLLDNQMRTEDGDLPLSTDLRDLNLKPLPDAPPRGESLVGLGQIGIYTSQMLELTNTTIQKLTLTSTLSAAAAATVSNMTVARND